VAVLKNGAGPTILVRTELDALPLQEKTGLAYASSARQSVGGAETFVDHACGHDIHMAAWVGTAKVMVEMKDKWRGTLVFIGQPAEESTGGAKAMLDDGLLTRFPRPDLGFGLHVGPSEAGTVSYMAGVSTSNSDSFQILFKGRGGHGSMPSMTIDPIVEAARFVMDVQTVVSREKRADAFGVVTVGAFNSGNAGNIIPDQATVRGTIRSYSPQVRQILVSGVERTANASAAMSGAPAPDVAILSGGRAVVNDAAITAKTALVFKAAFGDKAAADDKPSSASEDYSEFILAGVPSLFFGIGGTDPAVIAAAKAGGKPVPVNHSPFFAPLPEPAIKTGVEAMSLALMNILHR
jgi:hippurate hydrolase